MTEFNLKVMGKDLTVTVEDNNASIESELERAVCPSCGQPDCCFSCDGSQGADGTVEVADRLKYNAFLDAIESITLAHAAAGINVSDSNYVEGVENAVQAMANNL